MTVVASTDGATEVARSTPTTASAQQAAVAPRTERPARRTFTAQYKRRIVAEYDQALAGSKGQVLRREGLYESSIKQWRQQIEAGTLGRVSKKRPRAGLSPEQARIAELEKQVGKLEGHMPDGTFRFHAGGKDFGAMCMLGTFSERSVISQHSVVKVDDWLPLDKAVLVGCGVPSGWGTATYAGNVRQGDTVVIYGIGGLGINAVQGAVHSGARHVVVVDPVQFKRDEALKFGATHAFADAAEAHAEVEKLTWGQMADQALILVGTVDEQVVSSAFDVIGKGGTVVITGLGNMTDKTVQVSGTMMALFGKTITGTVFGSANPQYDIVKLLRLYDEGKLKLDELITTTYTLDQVNEGYQDLQDGKIMRGVIIHD